MQFGTSTLAPKARSWQTNPSSHSLSVSQSWKERIVKYKNKKRNFVRNGVLMILVYHSTFLPLDKRSTERIRSTVVHGGGEYLRLLHSNNHDLLPLDQNNLGWVIYHFQVFWHRRKCKWKYLTTKPKWYNAHRIPSITEHITFALDVPIAVA